MEAFALKSKPLNCIFPSGVAIPIASFCFPIAETIIANIKRNLKRNHQCVTIDEFCDSRGLKIEDVRNVLKR